MPRFTIKISLLIICCSAIFAAACTDARRLLEDKTASKAKGTAVKETQLSLPKETASPSVSPTASTSAKPAPISSSFKGDIAGKNGKEKLYSFLEKNDKKTVKLDVLLSDEQLQQLDDVDKGKRWYFDLAYPDKDGFNTGGELLIDISKGKTGLKLDGNHLQGQIKITGWNGPHQGLMSISARPVNAMGEQKLPGNSKAVATPGVKNQVVTKSRPAI